MNKLILHSNSRSLDSENSAAIKCFNGEWLTPVKIVWKV